MALNETYYQLISDEVLATHNELQADADTWGADTLVRMDALAAEASSQLSVLSGLSYLPTFTDDLDYVAPASVSAPDYSALGPSMPTLVDLGTDAVTAFSYTDSAYTAQLKNLMKTKLNIAIAGEVPYLPDGVFDAMYDRMLADMQAQYVADQWAATERGAALGWVLASETTLAGQAVADDAYSKARSIARASEFVKEWTLKHDDMWKGMTEGAKFENMWISEHHQRQTRLLDAAKATVDEAIRINADIIARNQQDLAAYTAEWQGLAIRIKSEVDMFQALIQNVGASIDSEKARFAYEDKQVSKSISNEDGETNLRIEDAKLAVENALGTLSKLAELSANISMALMSASDVGLSTGTNFGASETHSYAEKCCEA